MAIKQAEEDDYAVAEDVLMLLAATPFSTMTTPIELSLRLSEEENPPHSWQCMNPVSKSGKPREENTTRHSWVGDTVVRGGGIRMAVGSGVMRGRYMV